MTIIKAKFDTFLKKTPNQASSLKAEDLIFAEKDRTYPVDQVLSQSGLHIQIKVGYGAGIWWLFKPHWDLSALPNTSVVTAVFRLPVSVNQSSKLIEGHLNFYRGGNIEIGVGATSGAIGYRYRGAEKIRGKGPIPEGRLWKINTGGYWLDTRRVEGMFYHITPDPYKGNGFVRAEIGLHRDANVPGSAGCIVVTNSQMFNETIVPYLAALHREQKSIDLAVEYK
jgi:hypothetical protein